MPRLDIYVNYELQASVKLQTAEVRLGRDPQCEVHIPDELVSRIHAVIRERDDCHEIEDTSTTGTELNGSRLKAIHKLQPGDVIFISRSILVYQADEVEPAANASTVLAT